MHELASTRQFLLICNANFAAAEFPRKYFFLFLVPITTVLPRLLGAFNPDISAFGSPRNFSDWHTHGAASKLGEKALKYFLGNYVSFSRVLKFCLVGKHDEELSAFQHHQPSSDRRAAVAMDSLHRQQQAAAAAAAAAAARLRYMPDLLSMSGVGGGSALHGAFGGGGGQNRSPSPGSGGRGGGEGKDEEGNSYIDMEVNRKYVYVIFHTDNLKPKQNMNLFVHARRMGF